MSTKRWLYAVYGIVAMVFLGLIYAWSVFVRPLESEFGWLRSETSMIFSISMVGLCVGCLIAGFIARKISPRIIMVISALLVFCGFYLASQIETLNGLYLSYGVLCGVGVGLGYNAIMGSVLRWFPDMQGILSGILLMGFGFGGSIFGSVAVRMMGVMGWRKTFVILGCILGALVALSALLIKMPKQQQVGKTVDLGKNEKADFTPSQMLKERSFWGYFLWAALMSAAGLALIANAAAFSSTITADIGRATFLAGLINIFNGVGRFSFGFIFDILGSKKCLLIITLGFGVSCLVLTGAAVSSSEIILGAGFVLAGFFYGGITPSNSAFAAKVFGAKNYFSNFSIITLILLIAAFLGPAVSGMLQTQGGGFLSTLIMMIVLTAVSLPFYLLIKLHSKHRR